jgi:hypothetical protein
MILKRSVNGLIRYYRIDLLLNLFGEWMVIRTFGSIKYSVPTRVITTIYPEKIDAQTAYEALICKKELKGYRP